MRVGNFCVLIPEGREKDSGHVCLAHGQVYKLQLQNLWRDRACDAEITIDGKDQGGFRINAGCNITLERPSGDTGRFTFYRESSDDAGAAGVASVANADRGLITVRFRPEVKREPVQHSVRRGAGGQSCGGAERTLSLRSKGLESSTLTSSNLEAGITGLSGHSDQRFITVAALNYDAAEEVVISVRLVADVAVRELKPVTPQSNPVPQPLS